MKFGDLKKEGHWPTLFAAFLYFDFSFMMWTMLGPLATEINESLTSRGFSMNDDQTATLLAVPVLAGAILRLVLGIFVDKFGPKKTALVSQMIVIATLFYGYLAAETITYDQLLFVALGLGFAGASFAVALPQAGQWYPPRLQGTVLGIAGAGNIGVVIDFLFAPKIAEIWGWPSVFLVGGVLSFIVLIAYMFMAKDAPSSVYKANPKKLGDYMKLMRDRDTWWFNLFYAVSFGGFIGFANYMKVYLMNTYQADMSAFGINVMDESNVKVIAGYFGALCIFAGALLRPVGGAVADKMGGIKSLYVFYGSIIVLAFISAFVSLPFWAAILVMFLIMANLGMANGSVFQLVPQRFGKDIGVMTGLIGMAGGLGGTALIKTFGWSQGAFDGYSAGFVIFAVMTMIAISGISLVKTRWRTTWGATSGARI
ncbi:MAG: MFS transporter [Sulfuricurvum sp. GWF2_44_89]|uniref:MFS transporter n=1 Tax=Sulfuricurvum kujiense TaxID=148813 RepID=A0A2D3WBL0_9BACT|nr:MULTISPECIES: nitrate/nitrite transporter [Sulfuricurvum]OHD77522.1 MAG: MFS transporter [Sulfuricurvum sp. GWF2_44_89]OHD92227.1 MAG: MFS transporter [Sulfuricurvum sp. RIFOXYD2_FULL_44_160]OHD96436.1 MAG: MFS transporter [Sulfuricurvum sp. RIFOXYD12_FULL_44_77]DAB37808.1 MAG TPA: MFS transporter [Sulfuricurvum kujiense]